MENDLVIQRIKYLVEEGGLYPGDRPVTKNVLVRLAIAVLALQVVDIGLSIFTLITRH